MQVYTAHREWSKRPADQRFSTLEDLATAVNARRSISREERLTPTALRVVADEQAPGGADIRVRIGNGITARLGHWAFSQLAARAGAPAGYVRGLPARLAAEVLDYGITTRAARAVSAEGVDPYALVVLGQASAPVPMADANIAYLADGGARGTWLQAFTSADYTRIYDADVIQWVRSLVAGTSFKLPLAYQGGQWGAAKVPSGAYASDHDCFVFMTDDEHRVEAHGERLGRGFIVRNSEVGAAAFKLKTFLFREVCGNHIIWGARDVKDVRIPHVGRTAGARALASTRHAVAGYVNADTTAEVAMITAAQRYNVAPTAEKSIEWLRSKSFTKAEAVAAVRSAEQEEGGAGTLWELVNGLTASARTIGHADTRYDLERRAGKLLDLAV